jgi:hypothetical protein
MSVTVEQVKKLNADIEAKNREGSAAKARAQVLMEQLGSALANYESIYGVSLTGSTRKQTLKNIEMEVESVSNAVQAEYTASRKIIEAIERGDIDAAYALLGITPESEDDDVDATAEDDIVESDEDFDIDGVDYSADDDSGFEGLDDEDFSIDDDDPTVGSVSISAEGFEDDDLSIDDDEDFSIDDDDTPAKGSGDSDEFSLGGEDTVEGSVEDAFSGFGQDFGFGSALNGKFKV